LQISISQIPHQITCAIQSAADLPTPGIWKKSLCRFPSISQIASSHTLSTDIQFSVGSSRQEFSVLSQHIEPRIVHRSTKQRVYAILRRRLSDKPMRYFVRCLGWSIGIQQGDVGIPLEPVTT